MDDFIILVDDAVKTFRGGHRALDGLSLRVPSGVVYGLLGPNGAGKTTLIRVLATLLPLDAGTARVAGLDVRGDAAGVRNRIGLAGQYAAVDDYLTGRENVEMVGLLYGLTRREARRRAADVLECIDLAGVGDRPVRTYSGGMRRRLDLAASLVGAPPVLFLDEPTTGVDPASRRHLWDLVRDLVDGGTTVLLTTQYLEEADRLADRIALINHGRIVSEGTTGELKDRVGDAVVELDVADHDRPNTLAALRDIYDAPRTDGARLPIVVPAPQGKRSLQDVLHRLDVAGVAPASIGLRKPTLDEAFLSLTKPPTSTARAAR
ncbi:ATP-binding cassette domain-containing protein [Micromonospora cremea]|uniref:ABC-2 type transport system ATP-binding protein n=1 Tax=Micromonospora cremea TaxID=709881 RepID=A0A1N6AS42_9ACTN|nr:ATP-binding cassette domain-containing protein [Micromonospora cremea]SIN36833.1 ABC-2 type transport system ATP-binding protein [Micromonospora cremea]